MFCLNVVKNHANLHDQTFWPYWFSGRTQKTKLWMGTTNHGYNLILLHLAALKTNTANDIHMFNQPEDMRQSGWQDMVLSSCNSIKTFGLFTFYTTIPHSKLKGSFIKRMVNVYTNNLCQEGTDFIQIYHVWEGYFSRDTKHFMRRMAREI